MKHEKHLDSVTHCYLYLDTRIQNYVYVQGVHIYTYIYKISGACGCAFNDFTTLRFVFLVRGPGIMPEAGHEREEQVINSKHRPLKLKPHSEVRLC